MDEIKVGDIVCLASNPKCKFGVTALDGDIADCAGFDGKKAYTIKLNVGVLSHCAPPVQDEQAIIILPAKEMDIHQLDAYRDIWKQELRNIMSRYSDIYPEGHGLNILLTRDAEDPRKLALQAPRIPQPDYVMKDVIEGFERLLGRVEL